MGRIRVLSDQVANQIAAGEVVDRPASVVKELLENAIDAEATRIRVEVEAGGRKLIRVTDNGIGMMRDDAMLAFERHATSKIRSSDDLLTIATLGFRGEALPSIASISRLEMITRAQGEETGTCIEIAGGKMLRVEDAGAPPGTSFTIRDLFYNTPARRKFLKAESTELSHVSALVTHYALAHPDKHFELHSATHALLNAPPVNEPSERVFQIFGAETLNQLIPMAAERPFDRAGLPEPPPWRRDQDYEPPDPGFLRVKGFISKPALQKLNRNSIYIFINRRLVRDRLILHAITEGYRNIIPPTSFPVALLFLEMPPHEVDVNVHPAKTEVRFRQSSVLHDFLRDSIRNALMKARPAADFLAALSASEPVSSVLPTATPVQDSEVIPAGSEAAGEVAAFALTEPVLPSVEQPLPFARAEMTVPQVQGAAGSAPAPPAYPAVAGAAARVPGGNCGHDAGPEEIPPPGGEAGTLASLASLKPLGQLRESFILAVNDEGFWIIDQHVAHERVLFEKILREREVERVHRQRLLMPLLLDLLPHQMVRFAEIAQELERNGFEAEPFGPHTIAIKASPVGLEGARLERMLVEVLEQTGTGTQSENLETVRTRIAASIACHSAIKINTPLDPQRMEWLLAELARTAHPTSCPHGRPIALRYSWKDIQRAFERI
ncbi:MULTISPECIES: DNA mismatch repair endonuclease MutL [Acidobacterium]|uniref:DNA mismatch repair protein MutL n=1 Tax=Acidobacterium capsulatum (strain ATCC 51196 / DSM 11244 / BCRC 80197 / JCM 7670 / NBRC 15755 / NCIMB 13165 / 161) TaxID=240015 RepID=MUTL_ACIC5|nr:MULTISPECIES: DNA mismatch repair endonuclease MutL [Acidobacterium]C1F876.1 RecName: Full=DNA mismatch repair protein MutL [Acidobacterium capsulatum ATCC 51196]ACO34166.1 DNA mismatch repair protein MutL [Acidobacterium capsulatum ATCC 51196]HCT59763.1 DNA mismatch repair endonuclease MutL [Acidobacterium sp.]